MDMKKFKVITDNYFDGKISDAKNAIKELNQKELLRLIEYFLAFFTCLFRYFTRFNPLNSLHITIYYDYNIK
jgi:hypothetical protein